MYQGFAWTCVNIGIVIRTSIRCWRQVIIQSGGSCSSDTGARTSRVGHTFSVGIGSSRIGASACLSHAGRPIIHVRVLLSLQQPTFQEITQQINVL